MFLKIKPKNNPHKRVCSSPLVSPLSCVSCVHVFDLVWSTRYSPVFLSVSTLPCLALPCLDSLKTVILTYILVSVFLGPLSCVHRDTSILIGQQLCFIHYKAKLNDRFTQGFCLSLHNTLSNEVTRLITLALKLFHELCISAKLFNIDLMKYESPLLVLCCIIHLYFENTPFPVKETLLVQDRLMCVLARVWKPTVSEVRREYYCIYCFLFQV